MTSQSFILTWKTIWHANRQNFFVKSEFDRDGSKIWRSKNLGLIWNLVECVIPSQSRNSTNGNDRSRVYVLYLTHVEKMIRFFEDGRWIFWHRSTDYNFCKKWETRRLFGKSFSSFIHLGFNSKLKITLKFFFVKIWLFSVSLWSFFDEIIV